MKVISSGWLFVADSPRRRLQREFISVAGPGPAHTVVGNRAEVALLVNDDSGYWMY